MKYRRIFLKKIIKSGKRLSFFGAVFCRRRAYQVLGYHRESLYYVLLHASFR